MSESDAEPIDTTDAEDAEILLADPDDYHETQRLKEIHDARQAVAEQLRDIDIEEKGGTQIYLYALTELAHHISLYVNELLPLIETVNVDPELLELPEHCSHKNIQEYALNLGMTENGQPEGVRRSMEVYRRCNRILAEVKPVVTEDDTDEWEI